MFMKAIFLGITITGFILAVATVSNAQPVPQSSSSQLQQSSPVQRPTATSSVQLTLADVVKLVLQQNRDLKNAELDRIVQKQELKEAESKFNPTFTPNLSATINHRFQSSNGFATGDEDFSGGSESSSTSSSSSNTSTTNSLDSNSSDSKTDNNGGTNIGSGNSLKLGNSSELTYGAQLSVNWLSPLGTRLSTTVSPFFKSMDLTITQPLLRGAGRRINTASVKNARLNERKNILNLQQTQIDKLTDTVIAYRNLIKNQEAVRIQELALESKRRQLEGTKTLVNAGRKPQSELIQTEKSIADTERSLVLAKNTHAQANSDLLKLIESDQAFMIKIPDTDVDIIRRSNLPQVNQPSQELLAMAYKNRTDYRQSRFDIETEKSNLLIAKDNQRWNLDLQGSSGISESPSLSAGLVLSHTFGDSSTKTERIRREIGVKKIENKRSQLTNIIRQEVNDRLRDISSSLLQVTASQRAREFAQQQLDVAQTIFRRRGGQVTLFEIIQKQDDLVTAQNEELQAKIEYLNAVTNLEKTVGLTLEKWKVALQSN
jgi:outer membrane protein